MADTKTDNTLKPIINVAGLSVTYFRGRPNEVRALHNVSLDIYPGEFIIFFGPSGCGKSTLLYSIAGLETHAEGNIVVEGEKIAELNRRQVEHFRQRTVGMIFQAFYLISTLNVEKNVMLPQIAIGEPLHERQKRAEELLQRFNVIEQAKKLPTELSGGQQQRVAISRALINDPSIILADEPVGNLDSQSSGEVMKLLAELNTKQKKTIILVTHDPSHLHMAHRVFYMKDGRIIETKVNRAIDTQVIEEAEQQKPKISRELELLIRTYSSIAPGQIDTMLIPFKAKQIVADSLTGFSAEEIDQIEEQVQHMLMNKYSDTEEDLLAFLDNNLKEGGLALDRRTAKKITKHIAKVVEEVKALQEMEKEQKRGATRGVAKEIIAIRHYLLSTFNVELTKNEAIHRLDLAIMRRLNNKIDKAGLLEVLDMLYDEGGVGLDRRNARKLAKRLELLILGKYST